MSRKKNTATQKPAPMRWKFDPDIPTHDFLEEGPLDDTWNLQEAVENFVSGGGRGPVSHLGGSRL